MFGASKAKDVCISSDIWVNEESSEMRLKDLIRP